MRIAFLSYQWPGLRMGGIGSYVRQSAAALALAGHEPHVFTVGDADELPDNVPQGVILHQTLDPAGRVSTGNLHAELAAAINAGGEAIYRLAIAWLLTDAFHRIHREQPFDIVEVADVDASGLPLLLDPNRPVPVVVHLHTCTAIANRINNTALGPQEKLIEAMEAAQIHLADAVCAPTQSVIRATEAILPYAGFGGTATPRMLGATDPGRRNTSEPGVIPHPYVCPDAPFTPPPLDGPVVFVGRIEWRKGCGVIAEALNEFLARHPTVQFRFIGPDTSTAPGGTSVRSHILKTVNADLHDRVEFTGELPLPLVEEALRGSSFCVLPSLSENFSLAICEAMAIGRTTIVAAGTGSVELIGDAGVIVQPDDVSSLLDALDSTYRDRPRLNELSRRAFERVRRLCDPLVVSKHRVDFYRQIITRFQLRADDVDRSSSLPPQVASALLPCLSRMTAALVHIDANIDSPGHRLNHICQQINAGQPARVLLYGAGKHTGRLMSERHVWESNGHRVVGVIDDHPRFKQTPSFLDLPVRSLANTELVIRTGETLPTVILSTDTYQDQFWDKTATLRDLGVRVVRLYGPTKIEHSRTYRKAS